MLGISFDTPAENAAFAEKFGFPYPLLSDETREVGLAYGACDSKGDGYPRRLTFVIDADGLLIESIETKDPAGQADDLAARMIGS
ncbi:Putative peroxiredoxin [Planctomycetes bacterium Pla86]|uniref:Peroxiredoxin n=1 Tax=Engelhardtia mirabilis TaxID=2528011 RepID=A0A518BKU9_9BACT|nr:Putative peroxiredoxin [Planctomycetes bacterium Pla133]QDV01923.1 Putative peroxiredoxin [Planctomycetes bacterium Pla86]